MPKPLLPHHSSGHKEAVLAGRNLSSLKWSQREITAFQKNPQTPFKIISFVRFTESVRLMVWSDSLCVCCRGLLSSRYWLWWRRHTLLLVPHPSRLSQTLWTSCCYRAAGQPAGREQRLLLKDKNKRWTQGSISAAFIVILCHLCLSLICCQQFHHQITCFNRLRILIEEHKVWKTLSCEELLHSVDLWKMERKLLAQLHTAVYQTGG